MTTFQPLTADEIRSHAAAYFRQREGKTVAVDQLTMVLVGRHTGAGKSSSAALARDELRQSGGFVRLDADRLRECIDPNGAKPTSEPTQVAAGALADAVRAMATEVRRNVLEEGTFRNPAGDSALVQRIHEQGYRVEHAGVAIPLAESRLEMCQRFEAQHAQKALNPRFVADNYHDETAVGFAAALATVAQQFDRVRVISRCGDVHFYSRDASPQGSAIEALPWGQMIGDERLSEITRTWAIVRSLTQARGADTGHLKAVDRHHGGVLRYQASRRGFGRQWVPSTSPRLIDRRSANASTSRFDGGPAPR